LSHIEQNLVKAHTRKNWGNLMQTLVKREGEEDPRRSNLVAQLGNVPYSHLTSPVTQTR